MTAEQQRGLSERLQQACAELRTLEEEIKSGQVDPRVLREFREAVDHVRLTAWAVQKWIGLPSDEKERLSVFPVLTAERVHRATRISQDLTQDIETGGVPFGSQALKQLFAAVEGLYRSLQRFFSRSQPT